jgi:hypothetical protein
MIYIASAGLRSIRLDARLADHVAPFLGLSCDELAEIGRHASEPRYVRSWPQKPSVCNRNFPVRMRSLVSIPASLRYKQH